MTPRLAPVSVVVLLLSLAGTAAADGSGDILLDAFFDDLPLGPIGTGGAPSEPTEYVASFGTANVVDPGNGNRVLEMCDANALSAMFVTFQLLDNQELTSGTVCVTYTCAFPALDQWIINHRAPGSLDVAHLFLQMKFNAGGSIAFFDADDLAPAFATHPYAAGVPTTFRHEIDLDAGTSTLWIDDVPVFEDEAHGVTDRGFGRLQFGQNLDFDVGDCFTVDDVRVVTGTGGGASSAGTAAQLSEVLLADAFPNPFRANTRVRFHLPVAAEARLTIFDVRGRLVATLSDGPHGAGSHVRTWDGRHARGDRLAPGVYLARLEALGIIASRKLVLSD